MIRSGDGTAASLGLREAPNNIEAEQALLGAILTNNDVMDRVSSFLKAEHFFDPLHQRIFETAAKLIQNGKQATPITLKTYFETEEPITETLTVPQYLVRLVAQATTIINAEGFGQIIYDLFVRRNLIMIGEDMVNTAYDSPIEQPPATQIEEAEQRLYSVAEQQKYGQGFGRLGVALTDAIEMANAAYQRDGGLSGTSSGLRDLDTRMGGLQRSDLIILAGRPAMGKTALVTNIAFAVAKALEKEQQPDGSEKVVAGGTVGFFSLEMSSEQLATRILSQQAEISSESIRRGKINEDEFKRLVTTSKQLDALQLYIDDTGGISIAQLAARARRLKRQHGLDLLIVDYLQLLSGSSAKASQGRVQEMTEITTGLKALAKELDCPIIALSQLSRQVEQREDKRPQLADLRESGSIEQDADVVLFVYREEYYHERMKPNEGDPKFAEWLAHAEAITGVAEVIIAKQRHGPTGMVPLQFEGRFTRFSDLERRYDFGDAGGE